MMTSGGDWREITKDLRLVLRWMASVFVGLASILLIWNCRVKRKRLRITGVTLRG